MEKLFDGVHKCETLILSPHIDDEILGCFTFINSNTFILYFGVEERPYVSAKERITELTNSSSILGFSWNLCEFSVNHYDCRDLIETIEKYIQICKPKTILIPYYSYNQDHRAVYDAALTATRPHDLNWKVDRVLCYEQPDVVLYPYQQMNINFYKVLNIEAKIDAYKIYKSQVRGHRSPEILAAIGKIRGGQIGEPYAEGFSVIRYIE